jgi:predicted dehydrogenase
MAEEPVTVAVLGIDHRHAFSMLDGMLKAGCVAAGWWTDGAPVPLQSWMEQFPSIPRVDDHRSLLDRPDVDMVLIAAVPSDRARLAIEAMNAGKDVMTDKTGCVTLEELEQIKATVLRTGRKWYVNFGERFEVPSVAKAGDLIAEGAIGKVVHTAGFGPHRVNPPSRRPWFYEPRHYGGILADIASHQIDQFLFFTGSSTAEIVAATIGNYAHPQHAEFEDFGEILLRSDKGHGYIRVDWLTPDGLPTWGDGRLTIVGTEGFIELRKYIDVLGRKGTDHLFLTNGTRHEHIDCSREPLTYFARTVDDIRYRTETAMTQAHSFETTRLGLMAESTARRVGNLTERT